MLLANAGKAGQCIVEQPDDADAYYNMGIAYRNMGRHGEAISALEQYRRLDPNSEQADIAREKIAVLRQQGY